MVGRRFLPPVVAAALGAAAAFYPVACLPAALRAPVLRAVAFAALATGGAAAAFAAAEARKVRTAARSVRAFAAGISVGVAAAASLPPPPFAGLPAPLAVEARLASDPRAVRGGSALVELDLLSCSDAAGSAATARGRVAAFVPAERAADLAAEGRGAVFRLEGAFAEGPRGASFRARRALLLARANPAERARTALRSRIARAFAGESWGGTAIALLIGRKDELDGETADRFAEAGCSHVLALSGMHLALVAFAASAVLGRLLGKRAAAAACLAVLAAYSWLAGNQASLVRSLLMYALGSCADLSGRKGDPAALLAGAFLLQLCADPAGATSLSFTLSYAALAGLLIAGTAADELARGHFPACVAVPAGASLGAFLGTAGISAAAFGCVRPAALLASAPVGALASVFMAASAAWLAVAAACPPLAKPLSPLVGAVASGMDAAAGAASLLPAVPAGPVPATAASLAIGALLVYCRYRAREARTRIDPID